MPNNNQQHLLGLGLGLTDYQEMFDLNSNDLTKSILEYHAGPTSVNHTLQKQTEIISRDSLFKYSPTDIEASIANQLNDLKNYLDRHQEKLYWNQYRNPAALIEYRKQQLSQFLENYKSNRDNYQEDNHERIDGSYELALVSHFLFGEHSDDLDFHLAILENLTNVANEIRIFPLLNEDGEISQLVGPVSLALQQLNFGVEIREVKYHLQSNGNAMLRVWLQECIIEVED